jgi:hypothetical protein
VVVATVPGAGDHQLGPRRNAGPARPAGHPRRAAGPCRRARRRRRHTAQRRRGALLRRGPGRRRRHRAPARPDGASPGGPSPGVVAVRRRWLLDRGLRPRDPQHRPARGRRRARGRGPRRPSRGWSPTATPAPISRRRSPGEDPNDRDAGADVVYAPGLVALDDIARLVRDSGAPLNVVALPGGPSGNCSAPAPPPTLAAGWPAPISRRRSPGEDPNDRISVAPPADRTRGGDARHRP